MHRYIKFHFLLIFVIIGFSLQAQSPIIFGKVLDDASSSFVEAATIYVEGTNLAVSSDIEGDYRLVVEANQSIELVCSRVGYNDARIKLSAMPEGVKRNINFSMIEQAMDVEVVISESRIEDIGMVREEVTEFKKIPSSTGNLESVLPHIALGTSGGATGDLSSQYNVRGGNYDENLVYVNDFEIFRPQLIRSGQQEGLTFPNIDLISNLSFSSGGFEAKYGDKMSSVLDVRYKRPDRFGASVSASLLGVTGHLEGSKRLGPNSYNKFRYLVGARYKTTAYILGSLNVRGEYVPNFTDFQGYFTYDINKDFQIGAIGNFNNSVYDFVPVESSVALGLIDFALQLSTAFEGSESDRFRNGMGGLSLTYIPERSSNPFFMKLLASSYRGEENETFDIQGFYRLSQVETNFGSDNLGQEIAVLGTGVQHRFGRNFLFNQISNIEHKGGYELQLDKEDGDKSHFFLWGLKYQHEFIDDAINEWERIDSAGYSLPFNEDAVLVSEVLKSNNEISSNRLMGYVQDAFTIFTPGVREIKLTGGVRANYWSLNEELTISPRVQLLYKPLGKEREISYKLAAGLYYQPPFYRELRRLDGTLNQDLKAQRSLHIVGGMTYDFDWETISPKPFRLITELYYKKLDNLVSFDVDNVRIRYSGENDATGHVIGMDMRINGEFVPGAESWVNISLLQARESLNDVQHFKREVGDSTAIAVDNVPRPTDRLVNVSIYFQDYLPSNENFKMNLNLSAGGGLPFGVQDNNDVFRNTFRFRAYQRVDIGFSYQFWSEDWKKRRPNHPLRFTKNAWLSLEVFNLLGVENVASNTWVKTITNVQYAIPNLLTSRRINLRFKVDF